LATDPRERKAFEAPPRDGVIVIYSTTYCGDCRRAKRVFGAIGVDYTEINIDEDRAAAGVVMRLNGGMRSVPTILFPDGSVLVEPSAAALEAKLSTLAK
jgi:mycoredoxin